MAVNRDMVQVESETYELISTYLDAHRAATLRAWAVAWEELAAEVEAALLDLTAANATGRVARAQILRAERLQAALQAMGPALDRAAASVNLTLTEALRQSVQAAASAEAAIIAAQLPVQIAGAAAVPVATAVIAADPAQIAAVIDRVTRRIESQTAPLPREAQVAIRRQLLRGIVVGANPREAARRAMRGIEDLWTGASNRAVVIARTEMLDAHRAAAQAVDRANADVLQEWEWSADLSPRTCRGCLAMHGRRFPLTSPGPQGHQQCRCARRPVTKTWGELGFAGIEEPRPLTQSAEAYFNRLSETQQRGILGARGYEAWKAGVYPMDQWARKQSNAGWRDSWVATVPPRGVPAA